MTSPKEIGEAHKVKTVRLDYRVHVRGNPAEEALLIERMTQEGKTQQEIGKALSLSQPQISKRRMLLKLIPPLFEKLKSGELRPTAAYPLANMPKSIQKEYNGEEKITVKDVEASRRKILISSELEGLLLKRIDVGQSAPRSNGSPTDKDIVEVLKNGQTRLEQLVTTLHTPGHRDAEVEGTIKSAQFCVGQALNWLEARN